MQQRRLRLGDILDDYCPRERRITNHVVVAMIEDDVRQTRCTTCDAEHEYKQAKVPAPRRKKTGALSHPVAEGAVRVAPSPATPADAFSDEDLLDAPDDAITTGPDATAFADAELTDGELADSDVATDDEAATDDQAATDDEDGIGNRAEDEGPVHRRLIRATLPRPEGHVPERKEPDFTMRQPGGRDFNGNRNGNGNRGRHHGGGRHAHGAQPGSGQNRFGGQRHGSGGQRHGSGAPPGQGGQRQGNRQGQPGQPGQHRGGRPPGGGPNRGNGRKRGR